jgi:hypothetical protein
VSNLGGDLLSFLRSARGYRDAGGPQVTKCLDDRARGTACAKNQAHLPAEIRARVLLQE